MRLPPTDSNETPWGITWEALRFLDALAHLPSSKEGGSAVYWQTFGAVCEELARQGLVTVSRPDGVAQSMQVVAVTEKGQAVVACATAPTPQHRTAAEARLRSFDPEPVDGNEAWDRHQAAEKRGRELKGKLQDVMAEVYALGSPA